MTIIPGYTNCKKSSSWIPCLSIYARGILSGTEQKPDEISIHLAPEMPPSPEMTPSNCDSHSTFTSVSPSLSYSSFTTLLSVEKDDPKPLKDEKQYEFNSQQPQLTSFDHFVDRPLPTQRRSPGRKRHSSIKKSILPRISLSSNNYDAEMCTSTLDSLVQETIAYFIDTLPASSTSITALHGTGTNHTTEFVEKLKSKLISPVHPSLLKLVNDLLVYMNESPSLTNELEQLKPKLEICLLIYGKAVDYDS